jgi:hypothetical protein
MKTLLIANLVTLSFTTPVIAKGLGVGLILGDPTGISAKYFLGANAVDGAISYNDHEFVIYGDYLKHFPGWPGKENAFVAGLTPYVGVGPVIAITDDDKERNRRLLEDDDFALGARIPLGIEWMATEVPVGLSLELAPGILVAPETDGFGQGGFLARYYF